MIGVIRGNGRDVSENVKGFHYEFPTLSYCGLKINLFNDLEKKTKFIIYVSELHYFLSLFLITKWDKWLSLVFVSDTYLPDPFVSPLYTRNDSKKEKQMIYSKHI